MWQAGTFSPDIIERELGWAAAIGFNIVRVYLHDLVWENDERGFADRIRRFLNIASSLGIRTMFVFLDDCWNNKPRTGLQPRPVQGLHNHRWAQCPGAVRDSSTLKRLEKYVKGILSDFGNDDRVLCWDLYNEPGNSGYNADSLPLLRKVFEWARSTNPRQPLTSGIWSDHEEIRRFQLEASDSITFHAYGDVEHLTKRIAELRPFGRPLLCTEYMARTIGSRFQTHIPIFKRERIGCINWGLVNGKTMTIYPWGSKDGGPEPAVWFHDIFRQDGTPFCEEEIAIIKRAAGLA
jgi:hypothetical protein